MLEQFEQSFRAFDSQEVLIEGLQDLAISRDPLVGPLVAALLPPEEARRVLNGQYTSAFDAALRRRVGALRRANRDSEGAACVQALQKWRLRRVLEYIEAHVDQRILLAKLAQVAGLSRMYFAARFRAATGCSPHEYVVRRRIELAKEMLATSCEPIVSVALSLGFQTQSHFTTVFGRTVGLTPRQWRERHSSDSETADSTLAARLSTEETSPPFRRPGQASDQLPSSMTRVT